MFKKTLGSFLLALHNIRSHFFHTVLSVLGIVIGVAALVAILSLIDGMEKFAKKQISTTTSLNAIVIRTNTQKQINNVYVQKDTFTVLTYPHFIEVQKAISKPATTYIRWRATDQVAFGDSLQPVGVWISAMGSAISPYTKAITGQLFTEKEVEERAAVVVVNRQFALAVLKDTVSVIGQTLVYKDKTLRISGVYSGSDERNPSMVFPFTLLATEETRGNPPEIVVDVESTLDVNPVKDEITAWLKKKFPDDDLNVFTNNVRLEQAEKGFRLFRVIMGMIVGISVLVGGIGVMNVLLISVTQRTVEIGVRKAVGASRRDIILQFLAESITISAFGSLLGLILGIAGTMVAVPVINAITKVPFQAAYTLDTFLIISIIAVVIGIVFGTYPAIRASRLDPVEAIRRE